MAAFIVAKRKSNSRKAAAAVQEAIRVSCNNCGWRKRNSATAQRAFATYACLPNTRTEPQDPRTRTEGPYSQRSICKKGSIRKWPSIVVTCLSGRHQPKATQWMCCRQLNPAGGICTIFGDEFPFNRYFDDHPDHQRTSALVVPVSH